MGAILRDLVLDELPGPKRGQNPVLYLRDEIVWGPGERYFALAYTIAEASMMNEIGCVLWASFDGRTTVLGNPKGLYACCWNTPWCIWLDHETFVFKAQYSDGKRRYVPLVVIHQCRQGLCGSSRHQYRKGNARVRARIRRVIRQTR